MTQSQRRALALAVIVLCVFSSYRLYAMTVGGHPYSFYETSRLVVFFTGALAAYYFYSKRATVAAIVSAVFALFFNPFAPLRMRRFEWAPYDDWGALLALVGALFVVVLEFRSSLPEGEANPELVDK
jgi:hypothetical protein